MTKNLLKITLFGSILIMGTGCNHRLGQFTVASSKTIPNLNYKSENKTMVEGKDCTQIITIIPIGSSDDKIQRAMDSTIEKANTRGLKGNALIDVRVNSSWFYIPYIYGEDCVHVKGNLVELGSNS